MTDDNKFVTGPIGPVGRKIKIEEFQTFKDGLFACIWKAICKVLGVKTNA